MGPSILKAFYGQVGIRCFRGALDKFAMIDHVTPTTLRISGSVILAVSIFAIFTFLPTPATAIQGQDPVIPEYHGTVVDDLSDSFSLLGPRNFWHASDKGYADHAWWTVNNRLEEENKARWALSIPRPGEYEVVVFIPEDHATSETARYTLFHQKEKTQIAVNQLQNQNSWFVLGTFPFDGSGDEYLELSDATGEPDGKAEIGFDAAGFSSLGSGLEDKIVDAATKALGERIRMWLDEHTDDLRKEVKAWVQQQKGKILRQVGNSVTSWIDQQCTGLGAAMLLPAMALVLWAKRRPRG